MRLISCLIVFSGVAAAAEVRVRDLRVEFGTTPPLDRVEQSLSASGIDIEVDTDDSSGWRYALGFHGANISDGGGFAWGVGLQAMTIDYSSAIGDDDEVSGWGPFARIGYAYAFTQEIHLEVGPYVGFGAARSRFNGGSSSGTSSESGYYYEFGVQVGIFATLWDHLVIGAQGGWGRFTATFNSVDSAGIDSQAFTGDGPVGQISLGYRF